MPERLDLMISSSMTDRVPDAARVMSGLTDADEQVAEFIYSNGLAGKNYCCGIELVDNRGAAKHMPDIQLLALIHRTIERNAAKTRPAGTAPGFGERTPLILGLWKCNGRQPAYASQ